LTDLKLTFDPAIRKAQKPKVKRTVIAIEHEESKTSVDNMPTSTREGHNSNIAKRNGKIVVPNSLYSLLKRMSLFMIVD